MDDKEKARLRNQALFEQLMEGIGERLEDIKELLQEDADLEEHRRLIKGLAAGMLGVYFNHMADIEEGIDNV